MPLEQAKKKDFLINTAYITVVTALIVLGTRYLSFLLLPFLLGLVIAAILRPITRRVARFTKMNDRASAIFAAACFYLLLAILLWLIGTIVYVQMENFIRQIPGFYQETIYPMAQRIGEFAVGLLARFSQQAGQNVNIIFNTLGENAQQAITSLSADGIQGLTNMLKKVPMLFLTMLFTIISSVMICSDWPMVTGFLLRQVPYSWHIIIRDTRNFLFTTLSKFIKAYLIIMGVTLLELAAGLWLLKIDNWWKLAAIIAVLDLLPLLGSGGILIPWGIFWLISGSYALGGGLILLWAVVAVIRQFIEPKIVGDQIGLHPLVTITAMYIGLRVMGFGGLIIAPVLVLLIKYLHDTGRIRFYR